MELNYDYDLPKNRQKKQFKKMQKNYLKILKNSLLITQKDEYVVLKFGIIRELKCSNCEWEQSNEREEKEQNS